jgi:hypothetical protein
LVTYESVFYQSGRLLKIVDSQSVWLTIRWGGGLGCCFSLGGSFFIKHDTVLVVASVLRARIRRPIRLISKQNQLQAEILAYQLYPLPIFFLYLEEKKFDHSVR